MKTRLLKLIIITLLFPTISNSQNKDNATEDITQDNENFSSIMLNASYTSNSLEYLSGVTEKIPTLFTNLSFLHKSGFYSGIGYSNYFNDSVQSNDYNIDAGYQKYFNNGFDIDLSYSWHNFKGDSLLEGINYDHSVSLMLGQEIEKMYLSGDFSYKIGNTNNFFFDLNLSQFIQIDRLFSKNDVLLINPGISLSFGTDYWLYENMTADEKLATFIDLRNSGYSFDTFSYESFNFLIPISYGIKNTYLTFSWLYKMPGQKYKYLGWENQSGFMFSLTYFFNFSK